MRCRCLTAVTVGMLLATSLASAVAGTHCAKDEITYFSCNIAGSAKVVSLCGGYTNPNYPTTAWLQYRFGKVGEVEFSYPPSKPGSLKKFEATYFGKYHYLSVLFINEKALYEVELSEGYRANRQVITAVVNVENNKKRVKLACRAPVSTGYWDALIELSPQTFKSSGEGKDSFLYRYHNYIIKHDG